MADLKVAEAKERLGRQIFSEAWVVALNDWDLAQQYKKGLTRDPAAEEAHAKLIRCDRQGGEVGRWLENRGFNTLEEYLDGSRFEAEFKKAFGCASAPNRRGPKPKQFRAQVDEHLSDLFEHHSDLSPDDPKWQKQAQVETAVADYCESNGWTVAESTIRRWVSEFLERRKKDRQGS
jgi:hypothetical protein